jgi:hypothetical protein
MADTSKKLMTSKVKASSLITQLKDKAVITTYFLVFSNMAYFFVSFSKQAILLNLTKHKVMKKIFAVTAIAALLSVNSINAQKKKDVGTKVKNTAKDVGNKVAETASKGSSRVVDKVYKDKVGPDGQTIYIDNESKYYWVDKKGHRQYVEATVLKDKPKS